MFFAPPFGWTAYEEPIADLKSANVSSLLHALELLEVVLRFNVRSSVVEWSHPSLGAWVAENPRMIAKLKTILQERFTIYHGRGGAQVRSGSVGRGGQHHPV